MHSIKVASSIILKWMNRGPIKYVKALTDIILRKKILNGIRRCTNYTLQKA